VYAASADFIGALPIGHGRSFGIGGGYRAGNSAGGYGVTSFYFGPVQGTSWTFKARVGRDFVDVAVGGLYRLGKRVR
jgi:hypothetical protein